MKTGAVSQEVYEQDQRTSLISDRTVKEAEARLQQAKRELASVTSDGEHTIVAQARQQLARAKYDLDHATVRAPADGVVQQLALRPGARVVAMPLRAALVFVDTSRTRIAVAIHQNQLRYIREGQPAEITFKLLPGKTFVAKVLGIGATTSGGQVRSSGVVQDLSTNEKRAEPFQVTLELTDDRLIENDLPGGAVGYAAIYTEHVKFTHVIRKTMVRMQAWVNYLW